MYKWNEFIDKYKGGSMKAISFIESIPPDNMHSEHIALHTQHKVYFIHYYSITIVI